MRKPKQHGKRVAVLAAGAALMPVCSGLASLLGNQLYPANYPWNQNISNAPVATNSATIITGIGATIHVHPDWGDDNPTNGTSALYGIPFNVVHGNTTAKINVTIDNYPGESDIEPVPIPPNAVIEGDYQNGPNTNGPGYNTGQRGDSHLIVWDEDNNIGYELYAAARPSDPTTLNGTPTGGKWHAASETVWNFDTNGFRPLGFTSADAAGLSILAGLTRPDEGLATSQGGQGAINHALRLTLPQSKISKHYIYPASHVISGTGTLPMGSRLRLKNTTAINTLISRMGPQSQNIARAMQQYGLILADAGSSMYVSGTSAAINATNGISLTWDMNDVLSGVEQLTASDFDVLTLAPIVTGLSVTNGSPGRAVTVNGQNFSGAAGHLSVFFGSASAGFVNVLSDTQISLTVPSASGTVDVKVQSGTNEVDYYSYNTNADINNPIFGYGTSALTPADQFTFTMALPTIQHIAVSGKNIILSGTDNGGAGGTYHVLTSASLLLPRTNWTVVANGSFGTNGEFSFTNEIGTNPWQFYTLGVP